VNSDPDYIISSQYQWMQLMEKLDLDSCLGLPLVVQNVEGGNGQQAECHHTHQPWTHNKGKVLFILLKGTASQKTCLLHKSAFTVNTVHKRR
jgi:hypothetical protein